MLGADASAGDPQLDLNSETAALVFRPDEERDEEYRLPLYLLGQVRGHNFLSAGHVSV